MRFSLFLSFVFLSFLISAQGEKDFVSARQFAIGGAATGLIDNISSLDHQGGLGLLDSHSVFLSFQNKFLLPELNTFACGGIFHTKQGNWGTVLNRFGNQYYNQNTLGIAYGKTFTPQFSFGLRLNYHRIQQYEYGNIGYFTTELGLLTKINKDFSIATQVYNPFRTKINIENEDESFRIASGIKIGLNYSYENFRVLVDIANNTNQKLILSAGLEYHITKSIDLRTGFNYPNKGFSAGLGYKTKAFIFDFYYLHHLLLGASFGSTLAYEF